MDARVLASDQNRNPVVLENKCGKGAVYFGAFYDFPAEEGLIAFNRDLLSFLGERTREDFGIEGSKNINYSIWREDDSKTGKQGRMYLINVNWKIPRNKESFSLRLWGKEYPCMVRESVIRDVVWIDDIALGVEYKGVHISALRRSHNGNYTVELRGLGTTEITGFLRKGKIKKIIGAKGGRYKVTKVRGNKSTFSFSVDVEGNLKLTIDIV